MSSKKKQRNGFFYFMLDMREELRRQGRNVPMDQMSALAGPRWRHLSDAEKAAYNLRAKHEKRTGTYQISSEARVGRMDCMGELLSERRDIAAEREERRRRQKEILKDCLPKTKEVILTKLYLFDIQPLCELKDLEKERWLPCEMAIVEYSFEHGIHRSLHKFIDPGPIPIGYRYEAQSQSDRTHNIPVEGFELAVKDYREILSQLQTFVSSGSEGASASIPLLFAKRENVERVQFCLEWLYDKAGVPPFIENIFELETLIMLVDLYSESINSRDSSDSSIGPSLTLYQVTELLNTSVYDYEIGTRCGWHEHREIKFCSLATVNIYSYVISDHLCPKLKVSITPRHLPEQPEQPVGIIKSPNPNPPHRTFSRGVTEVSTGIHNMGMGRGRGRGLKVIRQPMAGRGMK